MLKIGAAYKQMQTKSLISIQLFNMYVYVYKIH